MNPFEFHTGFEFTSNETQLIGNCVFCGKEDHFHADSQKHLWDCKFCKRFGNLYQFLSAFHSEKCTSGPVSMLAEMRGIPLTYFRLNDIRFNSIRSGPNYLVWTIPTYNKEGSLNNLYKVSPDPERIGKLQIRGTPTLNSTLFNHPAKTKQTIWLHEGHWDKLAGEAIVGPSRDITCVGYPGSSFKQSWVILFGGKDLVIFPDHDKAGQDELKMIMSRIEAAPHKPRSISVVKYPEDSPKGFDVNDVLKIHGDGAYQFLEEHVHPYEASENNNIIENPFIASDESCTSFEMLLSDCANGVGEGSNGYYMTKEMELYVLLLITAVYSLKIEGEQIWVRGMGPPGSFKTTGAQIIGSSDQTVMLDTFTGLLSGWKDEQSVDASLISRIASRLLIIKDADALMQQPNIQQILSEFRAFYDKNISAAYRHRVSYDYRNIRSGVALLGTGVLRSLDNTALGERFLDYELHVTNNDRINIANRVLLNSIAMATSNTSPDNLLWARAKGFIDTHLLSRQGVANLGDREKRSIFELGSLIAYMRCPVERTFKGKLKYKPVPEVPSRIVGQLTKLFLCAPMVYGTHSVPEDVHILSNHIVADIINVDSKRFKICKALWIQPDMVGEELAQFTKIPFAECEQEMEDMALLGMLKITSRRTSTQHLLNQFQLREDINDQFKAVSLYGNL